MTREKLRPANYESVRWRSAARPQTEKSLDNQMVDRWVRAGGACAKMFAKDGASSLWEMSMLLPFPVLGK